MEIFKQITANNINLVEYPFRRELAMEAYLIENEEILQLDKENFVDVTVLDEEIALKAGRKSGDGRIDLLTSYGGEYLGIVELKLNEINHHSLEQLESYLDQKEQILQKGNNDYWSSDEPPNWVGVLVGSSIDPELQSLLSKGYKYKDIPIAGMTIKRFRSERNDIFVVSDTYFSYAYSKKDYSKFRFNGKTYNKGKLINAVVQSYAIANPEITFAALKRVFPDKIQGSFGVFDLAQNAREIYAKTSRKRHHINPDELIQLKDTEIATCTQWNAGTVTNFIKAAKKLNLKIERI